MATTATESKPISPVIETVKTTQEKFIDIACIRLKVFTYEQKCTLENEFDEIDPIATHLLLKDSLTQTPLGTLRLFPSESLTNSTGFKTCKIGRLAVLKPYRRHGFASLMMREAAKIAKELGFEKIVLHAQCTVLDFYMALGFVVVSHEVFYEENMAHKKMELVL